MNDVARQFVGTWRLVHSISIEADGRTVYPYGEDAVGYIYYGDTGIMGVHISRRMRTDLEALQTLRSDYLAYFGRFEIDTERQVVRHFVEGELFPGDHSTLLERRYRFDGDLLSLKPVDGTNREILWRRIGAQDRVEPETHNLFVVLGYDGAEAAAKRAAHRSAHRQRLEELEAQRRVLLAGGLGDGAGSLIVLAADSLEEAERLAKEDPYSVHGVFSRLEVHPFRATFPR